MSQTNTPAPPQGHPRGIYTLFFTEMWERFSYYGMRALLILYMVDTANGGLGFNEKYAAAVYGLYTAGVYLMTVPGGWVADRLLGAKRAVWIGGCVIAAGHFSLAVPRIEMFYLGLMLIVLGTGLLKPNISAIVGQLYPEGGARRDAGFTIFYMGINLGAAIGPLFCSYLGENPNLKHGWHYGFAAAGVGMVLGLIQLRLSARSLAGLGEFTGETPASTRRRDWKIVLGALGALGVLIVLMATKMVSINPIPLAKNTTYLILGGAALYFTVLMKDLKGIERRRMGVIVILFLSAAMFWSGFEQAGSSLNLFAKNYTIRTLGSGEYPAGWFQMLNPIYILIFAPVMAALWVGLARRNVPVPLPVKFGLGLGLLGLGFLVMVAGSKLALSTGKVWPTWLICTYLLHTVGELCLSPVGLSAVTKLSPPRLVGQVMGLWFLGSALGNLIAGLLAGEVSGESASAMPARFMQVVITACGTGLLLLIFQKPIRKWMGGVQ